MRRGPRSRRGRVVRVLERRVREVAIAVVAGVVTFAVAMVWVVPHFDSPDAPSPDDLAAQRVRELVNRYDCWVSEAPEEMAGRVPGHVVLTRDAASLPEYLGGVWVAVALEHVFDGTHPQVRVHAFCR